jgi:hypothetical protein
MRHSNVNLLTGMLLLLLLSQAPGSAAEQVDDCPSVDGDSRFDRMGCPDSDGDGWSDPDVNWTVSNGADAFPTHPLAWLDTDGDGYTDQPMTNMSDDCPYTKGTSRVILMGCSDIDRDFVPDLYDDDADGDGIRNEMERAASTGTRLYDPFNADSTPLDSDQDTIPDVIDDDMDDDGWPNDVENDRGSDPLDPEQTPFNIYFGVNTGLFYLGGLSFSHDYQERSLELSLSVVLDIVTEELVIPFLLIPVYIGLYLSRRRTFMRYDELISGVKTEVQLQRYEHEVNELIRTRRVRVHHGLVLRNAIEAREGVLRVQATVRPSLGGAEEE